MNAKNEETKAFRRVLLKVSGEALKGKSADPFDPAFLEYLAGEIRSVVDEGFEVGVVVGGGNIFRGLGGEQRGVERVTGDTMGMLATAINCLALSDALERAECPSVVFSAFPFPGALAMSANAARAALDDGIVVLFAGGTGNPFFSTDSASALRALETGCDALLKATKVDGVYDKDPVRYPDARFLRRVSFDEALSRDLKVMDAAAFSLCRDNGMPILVFNIFEKGNILKAVKGEEIGSVVG